MPGFDFNKLRGMVRAKKERERLAYRDIMDATGLDYHTIWHFVNKSGKPSAHKAAKLAEWVGLSVGRFGGQRDPVRSTGDALENIERLLKRDKSLRLSDRQGLMTIMRTAYRRAVEK